MKGFKVNFLNVLAFMVVFCSFAFFMWVVWQNYKDTNNYLSQILTAIIAMNMLILNFFFGSSKSSQTKDDTIASMQNNILNPPPTTVKADTVNADKVETVNTNTTNIKDNV